MYQGKKIAIIGASSGQLPIVKKANELGLETHCFAWEKGAVCKDICHQFHPISIFSTNDIISACKSLDIDGVASNASEETSYISSVIAEELNLPCTPSATIKKIQNKEITRQLTSNVKTISKPCIYSDVNSELISFPCVIKPVNGSSKKGVTFCKDANELSKAIEYAREYSDCILIEEFIEGEEYSLECLSAGGKHHLIQITHKVTTGFPHFVELEHHQPAQLSEEMRQLINVAISDILDSVGFTDGATHTEIKINNGNIYLIEINPRGGGDHISDTLIGLSTDCDYLKGIIDIALGKYEFNEVKNTAYSGILFLNKQNKRIEKYFNQNKESWIVERVRDNNPLVVSTSNYGHNGYLIYRSTTPIKI